MTRWKKRFSIAFAVHSAVLLTAMVAYLLANRATVAEEDVQFVEPLITVASFSFLGAFLAYRRPDHKIGWLLIAVALLQQTRIPSTVAEIALLEGAQPTAGLLFWGNLWQWAAGTAYTLLAYLFVLFPDGRLPSPRFRLANWLLAFVVLGTAGMIAFQGFDAARAFEDARAAGVGIVLTPIADSPMGDGSLHVRRIPQMAFVSYSLFAAATSVISMGFLSQVTRFRRGSTLERQQIKWVIFVMAVWLITAFIVLGLPEIRPALVLLVSPLLPSGIVVPIMRYRLYDIDVIIRRSLIFGVLTTLLALIYFGLVTILQYTVLWLIGESSPVIIVLSTLAIVRLFSPLRRRVQGFIDRRFYRRKYDAEKILAQFAATVQHEVDLQRLTTELVRLVDRTLQPESVSLWLKERPR